MPNARPSLKQLSFSLIVLMLRILNEQMTLAASDLPQVMHNESMIPKNVRINSIKNIAAFSPDDLRATVKKFCELEMYDALFNILKTIETPEGELHRFETVLGYLKYPTTTEAGALLSTVLFCSCYFIADFKPSTLTGQIIKDAMVDEINKRVSDINRALLDYHVMKGDYPKAATYLDSSLSIEYHQLFHRLTAREQHPEKLDQASILTLLQQNQFIPNPLPYAHPLFYAELAKGNPKNILPQIEMKLYTPAERLALETKPTSKASRIIIKDPGTYTLQEINTLMDALHDKDNPYTKFIQNDILASLAMDKVEKSKKQLSPRDVLKQLLIITTIDGLAVVSNFHQAVYNLLVSSGVQLEPDEALLLLRYLLSNGHQLSPHEKSHCANKYQKLILAYEHRSETPLLHFYDAFDEKLMRHHYPKHIADQIIEKEKALTKPGTQPTLETLDEKTPSSVGGAWLVLGTFIILALGAMKHLAYITNQRKKHIPQPERTQLKKQKKKANKNREETALPFAIQQPEILAPIADQEKPAPAPIIQPTLKEKIDKLIKNEKFPPQKWPAWVRLPSMTLDELESITKPHANDPYIKAQMRAQESLNAELITDKIKLDSLQHTYAALVHAYDNTLNPSDADLKEYEEKIRYSQLEASEIITTIQTNVDKFTETTSQIEAKIKQPTKSKSTTRESEEERIARIARLKADKIAKKTAKREEAERAAKIAEADERREAMRIAENKERLKEALLKRIAEPGEEIKNNFSDAHKALLILNDIRNADTKDTPYLRDACILSCLQLYEALYRFHKTIFKSILPSPYLLSTYRNIFAHDIPYTTATDEEWKQLATQTYNTYFTLVDAFHQVKPGEIYYVKDIPELGITITPGGEVPTDEKNRVFYDLCNRYLGFHGTLQTIYKTHKKQESPYQHEEINLIVIAMRGLILQIDDVANALGINAQNDYLATLAIYRNEEAHNQSVTEITALISLSKAVSGLMETIKLLMQNAKPSELGFYAKQKHPSPALPVFAKDAQTGREPTKLAFT